MTKSLRIREGDIKIQLNLLEDFQKSPKYSDGKTLSEKMSNNTKMINICPLDLRVNGVQRHIGEGSGISDKVLVVEQQGKDRIKIVFKGSTFTVTAQVRYLPFQHEHLPSRFRRNQQQPHWSSRHSGWRKKQRVHQSRQNNNCDSIE